MKLFRRQPETVTVQIQHGEHLTLNVSGAAADVLPLAREWAAGNPAAKQETAPKIKGAGFSSTERSGD